MIGEDFQVKTNTYEVVKVYKRTMAEGFTRLRAGSRVYFVIKIKGFLKSRGMKYNPDVEVRDAVSHKLLTNTTFNMLGRMIMENFEFKEI